MKKIIKLDDDNYERKVIESMDLLGNIFKLDDTKMYFCFNYNYKLKQKFNRIPEIEFELIKKKIKNNNIKDLFNSKYIIKYIYENLKCEKDINKLQTLFNLFPKEYIAALYIFNII